jgi:hypothetical protein
VSPRFVQSVQIAGMTLRVVFVLELILGILFWLNIARSLIPVHMLLGLLLVVLVWFLGAAQGLTKAGSVGLTLATFLVGLALAIVGLFQRGWVLNGAHWTIQVLHLLLALATVALGEISVARFRRGTSQAASTA